MAKTNTSGGGLTPGAKEAFAEGLFQLVGGGIAAKAFGYPEFRKAFMDTAARLGLDSKYLGVLLPVLPNLVAAVAARNGMVAEEVEGALRAFVHQYQQELAAGGANNKPADKADFLEALNGLEHRFQMEFWGLVNGMDRNVTPPATTSPWQDFLAKLQKLQVDRPKIEGLVAILKAPLPQDEKRKLVVDWVKQHDAGGGKKTVAQEVKGIFAGLKRVIVDGIKDLDDLLVNTGPANGELEIGLASAAEATRQERIKRQQQAAALLRSPNAKKFTPAFRKELQDIVNEVIT